MRIIAAAVLIVAGVLACSVTSTMQAFGTIEGIVKDRSGAVLPGVTVAVAAGDPSEKPRVAVTDGGGRYHVANVVPGRYIATFSLPGFTPVTRGLEVAAEMTATVDVDMRVAAVSETVTISGSPSAGLPSRPYVLCGLTIAPADPKLDARMRRPMPGGANSNPMRTVAPPICANK